MEESSKTTALTVSCKCEQRGTQIWEKFDVARSGPESWNV